MLNFELITPEQLVFSEEIYEAIIPTVNGEIAVLPGHEDLITLIKSGVLSLRRQKSDSDSQLEHVAVSGGLAEIGPDRVRILADSADRADEVSELEAKEARQKALELKEKAVDDVSLADATALLEKSMAWLKLAELKKGKHRQ